MNRLILKQFSSIVSFIQRHVNRFCIGTLIALSLFVLGYRLNELPVQSWDEGFYALMATDAGAVPLMPSIYGTPWIEKPPLSIWIMATSFNIFGVNVWALRLPSFLFAVLSIILFYQLGKELFGKKIGFTAAVLFLTSPIFLAPHMSRTGDIDTMLLAATLGVVLSYVRSWKRPRAWDAVAVWSAAGLLLRGTPIIPVILVVLLHSWLYRSSLDWSQRARSFGIFLLLALPWHLAAIILYGSDFVQGYLFHGLVSRINGAVDGHTGPWHYYLTEYFIPQLGLLLLVGCIALAWGIWRAIQKKDRITGLLTLWFVLVFGVLSLMSTKLYWYSMPAIPPLFLLGTAGVFALFQKLRTEKILNLKRVFALFVTLILFYFIASGLALSWRYLRLPKTVPVAQQLANQLAELPPLPTILYDPSLGTLRGRFGPQEEWYLNIRGKQNVGLVDQKSLDVWLEDPRTIRLILQTNDESFLRSHTNRMLCPEKTVGLYRLFTLPMKSVTTCRTLN